MSVSLQCLEPGDRVEVKYRHWRSGASGNEDFVERWVAAVVTVCEPGTWPLVRLADGQVTEIRPFMTWRCVMRARRERVALAA